MDARIAKALRSVHMSAEELGREIESLTFTMMLVTTVKVSYVALSPACRYSQFANPPLGMFADGRTSMTSTS